MQVLPEFSLPAWDLELPDFDCRHTLIMDEGVYWLLALPRELWVLEGKAVIVRGSVGSL